RCSSGTSGPAHSLAANSTAAATMSASASRRASAPRVSASSGSGSSSTISPPSPPPCCTSSARNPASSDAVSGNANSACSDVRCSDTTLCPARKDALTLMPSDYEEQPMPSLRHLMVAVLIACAAPAAFAQQTLEQQMTV